MSTSSLPLLSLEMEPSALARQAFYHLCYPPVLLFLLVLRQGLTSFVWDALQFGYPPASSFPVGGITAMHHHA
jgi:hypothetical protein